MILSLQNTKILPLPLNKRLAFIVGTGRCGLKSFRYLLEQQGGIYPDYEYLRITWDDPKQEGIVHIIVRMYGLLSLYEYVDMVVSIAHYYLPYVEAILETYPETKFLCLERDKELVVPSLIKQSKNRNFWTFTSSKHWASDDTRGKFYRTFPCFDAPKTEAAELYYDYYVNMSKELEKKYPESFRIVTVPSIYEDEEIQFEVLKFLGIETPKIVKDIRVK